VSNRQENTGIGARIEIGARTEIDARIEEA